MSQPDFMMQRIQRELRGNRTMIERYRKEIAGLKRQITGRNVLLRKLAASECNCSRSPGKCLRCEACDFMPTTQIVEAKSIKMFGGVGRPR